MRGIVCRLWTNSRWVLRQKKLCDEMTAFRSCGFRLRLLRFVSDEKGGKFFQMKLLRTYADKADSSKVNLLSAGG